jgi:uncharacterized linocin/CFP29 family protein
VNETSDYGYPIHEHIARVLDGEIIWAPTIDGAFLGYTSEAAVALTAQGRASAPRA